MFGHNGKVGLPAHDDLVKPRLITDVPNRLWPSYIAGTATLYLGAFDGAFAWSALPDQVPLRFVFSGARWKLFLDRVPRGSCGDVTGSCPGSTGARVLRGS